MKKLIHFILIAGLGILGGCKDEDTLTKYLSDRVDITDTKLVLPSSGRTVGSTIITSDLPWTMEGGGSWCSFSPASGGEGTTTVVFTLEPNDTYDDRSVNLTLKTASGNTVITVYQKQKDAIIFSADYFEIQQAGDVIEVDVQSNVEYDVTIIEGEEWITQLPDRTRTRGLTGRTIPFEVDATQNLEFRVGLIRFYSAETKLADTVTVYQVQKDQVILNPKEGRAALDGETIRVQLVSNIDYQVEIPTEYGWIHQEESQRADQLLFRIDPSAAERTGVVNIKDKNNPQFNVPYTINQLEKITLEFTSDEINISRVAQRIQVKIKENVEGKYEVIIPPFATWVKVAPGTRAMNYHDVYLDIAENGIDEIARETRIIVQGTENKDLLTSFTIKQAGGRTVPEDERETLLKIAQQLNFEKWQNNYKTTWVDTVDISRWNGVTLKNGKVSALSFSTNAAGASYPKELGDLIHLETLTLNRANIKGALPSQIANLKKLTRLEVTVAHEICPEIGALTNLTSLRLSNSGMIIPEATFEAISFLENLETLQLGGGTYPAEMPESWGNLKNLKSFAFQSGSALRKIDPISRMTKLTSLDLYSNSTLDEIPDLSALTELDYLRIYTCPNVTALPSSVGELKKLKTLYIGASGITALPREIGGLENLTSLTLYNNLQLKLIPDELCDITSLTALTITGNTALDCVLPENIGNLNKLSGALNIYNNAITGPIPESISRLTGVTTLNFYGNQFSSIPESMGNMTQLTAISMYNNSFESGIPESFRKLKNVKTLYLYQTNKEANKGLIGMLPEGLAEMESLTTLRLENTRLFGSIPESWGNFSNLTTMTMSGCELTGRLPETLSKIATLTSLSLQDNHLTGSIPESFANFKVLTTLNLQNNQLDGTLPIALPNVLTLTTVRLQNNRLSGSLPETWGKFSKMNILDLSNNEFTGGIPEGFEGGGSCYSISSSTSLLNIEYNKLTGKIPDKFYTKASNLRSNGTVVIYYSNQKPGYGFEPYVKQ